MKNKSTNIPDSIEKILREEYSQEKNVSNTKITLHQMFTSKNYRYEAERTPRPTIKGIEPAHGDRKGNEKVKITVEYPQEGLDNTIFHATFRLGERPVQNLELECKKEPSTFVFSGVTPPCENCGPVDLTGMINSNLECSSDVSFLFEASHLVQPQQQRRQQRFGDGSDEKLALRVQQSSSPPEKHQKELQSRFDSASSFEEKDTNKLQCLNISSIYSEKSNQSFSHSISTPLTASSISSSFSSFEPNDLNE